MRRIRYQEIADDLRERALHEPAGSVLPSEAEMSTEYGASRVTIRRALELVREEGLIAARQGFGWFVATEPVRQSLESLEELSRCLAALSTALDGLEDLADGLEQRLEEEAGRIGVGERVV